MTISIDSNVKNGLGPIEKSQKSGDEQFYCSGDQPNFSLLDFWKWSVSDLVSNSQRGVLSEYIVAQALGINLSNDVRNEWKSYDLLMSDGTKIEVKSAAYIQSWTQKDLSEISFGIGKTKE